MREILAIVATYNRKDLLDKCLNKLKNQTQPLDVLVIDNGSTDGTEQLIKIRYPDIIYFNTHINLGGAGAFNLGIKKGVMLGYKYLWIMDDDTFPDEFALENFIKVDKNLNGKYGFLASKVLWKDGSLCKMNIQKISKWKKLSNINTVEKIQFSSFVSLFIKSKTVLKYGLPYKDFFIWGDDTEFTRRISRNEDCYFVNDSVVFHWMKNNEPTNIANCSIDRIDRFKFKIRNDVVVARLDGIVGFLFLLIHLLSDIIKIIFYSKNKTLKITMLFKYTYKGVNFHPTIEYITMEKQANCVRSQKSDRQ